MPVRRGRPRPSLLLLLATACGGAPGEAPPSSGVAQRPPVLAPPQGAPPPQPARPDAPSVRRPGPIEAPREPSAPVVTAPREPTIRPARLPVGEGAWEPPPPPLPPPPVPIRFTDRGAQAAFAFDAGTAYPRTLGTGGGFAVFDADADGDLDVFLTSDAGLSTAYRNDGGFLLREATQALGLSGHDHVVAVALGDCDGDGDLELFLSRWGESRLLRNDGPGSFADITQEAGLLVGDRLGSASVFLDLDHDGDLDLLQSLYRDWESVALVPVPPRVFLNDGACGFTEDAFALGLPAGITLGLGPVDADRDGDLDLAIANDFGMHHVPSGLFTWDEAQGRFEDTMAFSRAQARVYGMGATGADFDGDGWPEILFSNFFVNPFFHAIGGGRFQEEAELRGVDDAWYLDPQQTPGVMRWFDPASEYELERQLATYVEDWTGTRPANPQSFMKVNWALEPGDFDADGALDLFVTSGKIGANGGFPEGLFQPDALFRNTGGAQFEDVAREAEIADRRPGRGAAVADLDGDGALDVLVFHAWRREQPNAAHGVYRNVTQTPGAWLKVQLRGAAPNTWAVGAHVEVRAGARSWHRWRLLGSSNFSAVADDLHVGLGAAASIDELVVTWPDGLVTTVPGPLPPNQRLVIDHPQR